MTAGPLALAAHARLDERAAAELEALTAAKLDFDPFTDSGRAASPWVCDVSIFQICFGVRVAA